MIFWDSEAWFIRDLGSRNGTRVDGRALAANENARLEAGATVEFGGHPLAWLVDSVAPAIPRAVAVDGDQTVDGVDGILALPNETSFEAVVYGDPREGWVVERSDRVFPVADLDVVTLETGTWRLHLPQLLEPTTDVHQGPTSLAELALRFEVSRDEEHVRIVAEGAGGELDLGSRTHHYTLLTLARARLADGELGPEARGWVYQDELCDQLRLDRGKLNMLVFRARKQLASLGIQDARGLVQRRVDSQQLRLGVSRVAVVTAS